MTWEELKQHIDVSQFSASDQDKLYEALEILYDHSETAHAMLDAVAANGLIINNAKLSTGGEARYSPWPWGSYKISLDLNDISNSSNFNDTGELKPNLLPLAIAHELSHAAWDTMDPTAAGTSATNDQQNQPDWHFAGSVGFWGSPAPAIYSDIISNAGAVGIQNLVDDELAVWNPAQYLGYHRVSYQGSVTQYVNPNAPYPPTQLSDVYQTFTPPGGFTEGNAINILRMGLDASSTMRDDMDMSDRSDGSSILAFGRGGDDTIVGAGGDDWLYGMVGNDTLSGRGGDNYLHGGLLGQDISVDGIDTADYSKAPSGIKLSIGNPTNGEINVDDNGFHDPNGDTYHDRLVSIETILGSKTGADQITINDASLSGYSLTGGKLTIDGEGGGNSVIFTNEVNGTWTLDSVIHVGNLTLKHFPSVQFSAADDTLKLEYAYNAEGVPERVGSGAHIDMGGGDNTLDLSDIKNASVGPGFDSTAGMLVAEGAAFSNVDHIIAGGVGHSSVYVSGFDLHGRTMTIDYGGGGSNSMIGGAGTYIVNGGSGYDSVYLWGAASQYTYSGSESSLTVSGPNGFSATLNNIEEVDFQSSAVDVAYGGPDSYYYDVAPISLLYPDGVGGLSIGAGGRFYTDSDFAASHSVEVVNSSSLISIDASIARETAEYDRDGNLIPTTGLIATNFTVLDTPKFGTYVPYTILLTSSDGKEVSLPMMAYVAGSQSQSTPSVNPGGVTTANIVESYATPFDGRQTVSGAFSFTDANSSNYTLEIYGDGSDIPDDFTASVVGGSGGGTVQWTYSIPESFFQSLAPNTSFVRSFGLLVRDDIGSGITNDVYFNERSRPVGTTMVAGSNTGNPSVITQGSTPDGKHVVSGSFDFADPDTRDLHTVSTAVVSGGMPGNFEAHIETDSTGGGTGRVAWSFTVNDDQLGPFPGDYTTTFAIHLDDGHGGQQPEPVQVVVGAKSVIPAVAPVIAASPATMIVWAGGYQSYGTGYNTYTDQDTRIHHTIATSFAGTGAALGTMFATLADTTYGSTQQSPTGSYSLIYTVDPAILNAMQDGQVVTETWHVTLGSDYGLTSTQDETVVVQRQNGTAIDTANIYNGTVQADVPPSDWTAPPGAFLFTDSNALDAHTVTSSFKSSSTGGGPLGTFSTNMLYDTWNSPFGEGILGWNYDASHVRPWSHTPQTVVETWTVNLNDGHGGITSQDVQVTIDVPASNNQVPVAGAITLGTVSQNAASVHVNLLSTSSDPDAGDTLSIVANSLTVSSSDGHAVVPLMEADGHTATIDPAAFAYLAAGEHADLVFNFDVTDGIDTTRGTATMTVTGVNDAPTAVAWASGGTVGENVADNSVIGQLKAFDPDHNDTFVWALQTNEDHLFAVSSTGQVTTVNGEAMDHNIYPNGYDIAVTATDAGGLSVTQTVHIGQGSTVGAVITDTTGGLTLTGTSGDDKITGGHGDIINAGAGNDLVILGDDGSTLNQVDGGTGINTIDLSTRSAAVNLNLQNGQFVDLNGHATGENATHFNNVVGTQFNDRFYTTSDYNHVTSGPGNDAIVGYGYNDYIDGGDGFDTVNFSGTTQDIDVNLKTGATSLAYAHETLLNIEGVIGGSGNDTIVLPDAGATWGSSGSTPLNGGYVQETSGNNTITGGNGNDQIYGGTGNDVINGGGGIDVISGGGGNDIITGGAGNDGISVSHPGGLGNDQFNYAFGDGTDTINGFLQGNDTINIARIAGKADPVVSIGPNGFATDVHITWYDTTPVAGQPTPNHVDADILLHGVILNSFVANQDYHLV